MRRVERHDSEAALVFMQMADAFERLLRHLLVIDVAAPE